MKPLRVALSGSGFRLGAHLGALQAIEDAGYKIVELAGTSGGSIVASMYASGVPLDVMRQMLMEMDWSRMMSFSPWTLIRHQALCSGEVLREYLMGVTSGKTFAELEIDLKVIATDLLSEREFQFSKTSTPDVPIALAARASASIPIVFVPVSVAGGLFVDGGMCDNMPVSDLTVDDVQRVGIFLESDDSPLLPGRYGIATLAPRMIDVMLASNEDTHFALDQMTGAAFVRVPTGYASSFDRHMTVATRQRLYDDGYRATAGALSEMLAEAQ
ncbi:patatin-like phospholipase family protein [Burkholderia cepacia]|jgi:NTE family protein|uniref:patatin-like phospholipase family protein n=1 Tax=Burkholderia cenocepacia TaxID=95486 RepID=UPI0004F873E4|nr:patatin-like phospholipase family protein [Burkholderia cenocepacia]AIO44813.1 patatin-like phospholipase family protein [Burkholderia cepacia]KGC01647.1 patatin-like phospholipase family protein [Burkholderia cepacia]MDN7662753.1 patatin-like phospholipase family protein [Burkholderia cenocepacia]